MSDIVKILPYRVDLGDTLSKTELHTIFVMSECLAHRFEIEIKSGGKDVDLSGRTVTASFTNFRENTTIEMTGEVKDGKAVVTLESPCYTLRGQFVLIVEIHDGDADVAVFLGEGHMRTSRAEKIIYDDYIVMDADALLAHIAAMKSATDRANTAADRVERMQIDASGLAGNANRLGGKPPEYYIQPMDLLHNSYFLNAVNQRGETSFASNSYFIDRWRAGITGTLGAMHFSISGEGLKMVSTVDRYVDIFQQLEQYALLKGKIFTFAAKIVYKGQEAVVAKTFALGSLGSGATLTDDGNVVLYSVDSLNVCIRLYGNNGTANELTLRWAALYEGAYTVETLPPYVPKGYAAELAACQYYATVIEVPVNSRIGIIRSGSSNGILLLNVPTMRNGVVPSFSALSGSIGGLVLDNSGIYGATITTYGPVVGNTVNAILNFASNNSKPNTIDTVRNAGTETFKLLISVDL